MPIPGTCEGFLSIPDVAIIASERLRTKERKESGRTASIGAQAFVVAVGVKGKWALLT